MVNENQLKAFLMHNFQPLSKKNCIESVLIVWFLSVFLCIFNEAKTILYGVFIADVVITVFSLILMLGFRKSVVAVFLFDGVSSLYQSVLFNIFSYSLLIFCDPKKQSLAVVFPILFLIGIFGSSLLIFYQIRNGTYSKKKILKSPVTAISVFVALVGIIFSRVFLKSISQSIMLPIISAIFLLISMIFTIGIGYFIRIFIYQKLKKQNDPELQILFQNDDS